jgi:tetratricopeptide (TPR) repeat protein
MLRPNTKEPRHLAELLDRLKTAVGDTYRLEKELGGGGMSRVFLAEEIELGRRVVIKVLPPEMAADVSKERFHREIQLAAKLQHPLVVSLLTAGSEGDLLYYVMPYIEGESLRAKLAREGELPIGEAVRMLKDVMEALAYAHKNGVVHRDIKPDNVLLTEGHAVVADFGVAKAVTASSGTSSLTSLGVALGTPAYMAPEQAAADPHTDHRADIYAVGALAYEMLSGRPPFTAPTPQAVMAAHVSETPEPVTKHRSAVSEGLNALVMRCLEKKAADRWQSAADLVPQLEAMTTPSGGVTPTGTQPVAAVSAETLLRRSHPARVAGLFGLASVALLGVVYFLMMQLGLPGWVFPGAIALLVVGLPIMLVTSRIERRRAIATTTGISLPSTDTGMHSWFTWRNATVGGGFAFAALGMGTIAYMTMRVLGIGPAGTLMASGALDAQGRLLIADFQNRTADSTLGMSLTEALRVGLAQSPVIKLVDASTIAQVLQRMNRDPGSPVDLQLAREIAEREGVNAIVAAEVGPIGEGYMLSARLLSAADGSELLTVGESANDDGELISAIDRLSARLRERIGESLRTIRANEPLDQVTTASLQALRRYSQAVRAFELEADYERAIPLLEEAVALDTAFAMAYRKLGVALNNLSQERTRQIQVLTKAFEHQDRLPEYERYFTIASYYSNIGDVDKAISTYETLVEAYPDDFRALNNLGNLYAYTGRRNWVEAERLYQAAIEAAPHTPIPYQHATAMAVALGRPEDAQATIDLLAEQFPDYPQVRDIRAHLASFLGNYDEAETHVVALQEAERGSLRWQSATNDRLGALSTLRGKLRASGGNLRGQMQAEERRGLPAEYLEAAIDLAWTDVRFGEAPLAGVEQIEAALDRYPLDSLPAADRPYLGLAYLYANAGRLQRAKELMADYETVVPEDARRSQSFRYAARGAIAMADGQFQDAIVEFRSWDGETGCPTCALPDLAQAYDMAGEVDSALVIYERFTTTPWLWDRLSSSYARSLPASYKRLGELYEEAQERDKAVDYYNRFVELWQDADDELQAQVTDVKGRIARLIGER